MEITTKILEIDGKKETVSYYPNTEKINIGDTFLFSFGGKWDIGVCSSENEMFEINQNDRVYNENVIDLVTGFWEHCYKVFRTTYKVKQ